jgi:hypothetical protein
MGRARDVADAEQQTNDETWQCKTCSLPAEQDGEFCLHCRLYWEGSLEWE